MFEYKKLEEAKHFYNEMLNNKEDQKLFEFNLSACTSAARSILQYALEEVKLNGNQSWFDKSVNFSSYIKYFKDKRDINIHREPVKTKVRHGLSVVLTLSTSVSFEVMDKDGKIISQSSKPTIPEKENSRSNISHSTRYIFDDWNGNEDAIELSQKYLNELEAFIKEGIRLKFITG